MKLSIWHSKVLYIMTRMPLDVVSSKADLELDLLINCADHEDWHSKKAKFAKLSLEKKQDLDILEILIGEFKEDELRLSYVLNILQKIKDRAASKVKDKESVKEQIVSRLSEYGLDADNARNLISDIEKEISGLPSESESLTDIVNRTEPTIQERIDAVAAKYEMHNGYLRYKQNTALAQLDEHIAFFSRMMTQLNAKISNSLPVEDLINVQRYISYAATSYHKLVQLRYEMSGARRYVNHDAAMAKIFGQGYVVMKRDEMGRIVTGAN